MCTEHSERCLRDTSGAGTVNPAFQSASCCSRTSVCDSDPLPHQLLHVCRLCARTDACLLGGLENDCVTSLAYSSCLPSLLSDMPMRLVSLARSSHRRHLTSRSTLGPQARAQYWAQPRLLFYPTTQAFVDWPSIGTRLNHLGCRNYRRMTPWRFPCPGRQRLPHFIDLLSCG